IAAALAADPAARRVALRNVFGLQSSLQQRKGGVFAEARSLLLWHQKMPVRDGDRSVRIVLPCLRANVGDSPAVLGDRRARVRVARPGRAQVLDREVDRLGEPITLPFADELEDRRHLEKCTDHATVYRRQVRVADDAWIEA